MDCWLEHLAKGVFEVASAVVFVVRDAAHEHDGFCVSVDDVFCHSELRAFV